MVKIKRTKYIIRRRRDGAVLCYGMKKAEFVLPENIDKQIIKLYRSEDVALASAEAAGYNRDKVAAEMVIESIETV